MEQRAQLGGQAVIEGVMMRSENAVSVAVRRGDGSIVYQKRDFISLSKRYTFWGLPLVRGAVTLIESLLLGIQALTFSSEVAMEDSPEGKGERADASHFKMVIIPKITMAVTMLVALALGMALFFYLPLTVTHFFGIQSGILFNAVDGILRLLVFLLYLGAISMWKEIQRLFEYHGAEHKSICTFENNETLEPESALKYSTKHPRCGTSFLLVVVIISIFVFVLLRKPASPLDPIVIARLALVPVIAGISYEIIKLGDRYKGNPLIALFLAPGLWLQKITTREPDRAQLEVAFVALKSALGEDVTAVANPYSE